MRFSMKRKLITPLLERMRRINNGNRTWKSWSNRKSHFTRLSVTRYLPQSDGIAQFIVRIQNDFLQFTWHWHQFSVGRALRRRFLEDNRPSFPTTNHCTFTYVFPTRHMIAANCTIVRATRNCQHFSKQKKACREDSQRENYQLSSSNLIPFLFTEAQLQKRPHIEIAIQNRIDLKLRRWMADRLKYKTIVDCWASDNESLLTNVFHCFYVHRND